MMRTLLLAAVRAFVMGRGRQCMMRPTHVARRRRLFSLWDRHGGYLLQSVPEPSGRAVKAGGGGSRKRTKVSSGKNGQIPGFIPYPSEP